MNFLIIKTLLLWTVLCWPMEAVVKVWTCRSRKRGAWDKKVSDLACVKNENYFYKMNSEFWLKAENYFLQLIIILTPAFCTKAKTNFFTVDVNSKICNKKSTGCKFQNQIAHLLLCEPQLGAHCLTETNTFFNMRQIFCNLRQMNFAIWDKFILQYETNTF